MGDTDDDDVKAKVLVCKQNGLSGFLIDGQCRTVRAFAVDPLTDRQFYLMLMGAKAPDDFTFAEVIDGRARDENGQYVDVDVPERWAPNTSINDFLQVVGGELDEEFWDAALASFLDLYRTVDAAITTAVYYAEYQQGERMTILCGEANVHGSPADGDAEEKFQAFTKACQRRAPFAETIVVEFPDHTELFRDLVMGCDAILPRVSFGYRPGQDDQVSFIATGVDYFQPNLYLNGCWTRKESLEEDLLEAYADPWDRHGAKNAAQDLLAIQSKAMEFLSAEHSRAVKRLDEQRAALALEVFGGYEANYVLQDFDRERDDKLREELSGPIKRVEKYLATCCAGGRKTALP